MTRARGIHQLPLRPSLAVAPSSARFASTCFAGAHLLALSTPAGALQAPGGGQPAHVGKSARVAASEAPPTREGKGRLPRGGFVGFSAWPRRLRVGWLRSTTPCRRRSRARSCRARSPAQGGAGPEGALRNRAPRCESWPRRVVKEAAHASPTCLRLELRLRARARGHGNPEPRQRRGRL